MKNYLIAERYAKGLSRAIEDDSRLEAAAQHLRAVRGIYEQDHDFRSVLANPAIEVKQRASILEAVVEAVEADAPVTRLLQVVLRRGRIAVLPDVSEVFDSIVDERLNRQGARVASATPLDEGQRERLGHALEAFSGKSVRMECTVDPELLGGVVARMGSTVLDGSVRTRLARLRNTLLSEET